MCVALFSCSGAHHLKKAMRKSPELFNDTTVKVLPPEIVVQTKLIPMNTDSLLNAAFKEYSEICDELSEESYNIGLMNGQKLSKEKHETVKTTKAVVKKQLAKRKCFELPFSDTLQNATVWIDSAGNLTVIAKSDTITVNVETVVDPNLEQAKSLVKNKYFLISKGWFWSILALKLILLLIFLYFSGKLSPLTAWLKGMK